MKEVKIGNIPNTDNLFRFSMDTAVPSFLSPYVPSDQLVKIAEDGEESWMIISGERIFSSARTILETRTPNFTVSTLIDREGVKRLETVSIYPETATISEEAAEKLKSKGIKSFDFPAYLLMIYPTQIGIKPDLGQDPENITPAQQENEIFFPRIKKNWQKTEENNRIRYRGHLKDEPPFFLEVELLDDKQDYPDISKVLRMNFSTELEIIIDKIRKSPDTKSLDKVIRENIHYGIHIGIAEKQEVKK